MVLGSLLTRDNKQGAVPHKGFPVPVNNDACSKMSAALKKLTLEQKKKVIPSLLWENGISVIDDYLCLSCVLPDTFPHKRLMEDTRALVKHALREKRKLYEYNHWAHHGGWEEEAERVVDAIGNILSTECIVPKKNIWY